MQRDCCFLWQAVAADMGGNRSEPAPGDRVVEHILLHDSRTITEGAEGLISRVNSVDDFADPGIHRRGACAAVPEQADAARDLFADAVDALLYFHAFIIRTVIQRFRIDLSGSDFFRRVHDIRDPVAQGTCRKLLRGSPGKSFGRRE